MPALGPPELEYPLNGATTIMVSLICKNYVMIYKRKRHYIAAQGPTPLTLSDFWRLLWATPHYSWFPSAACPPLAVPTEEMKCSGYKVQIESDDGGSILEAETSTVITRFVPVHGLALGTHRWRVGAIPSELVGLDATYAEIQTAFASASNNTGSASSGGAGILIQFDPAT
eukprot:gene9489-34960_t